MRSVFKTTVLIAGLAFAGVASATPLAQGDAIKLDFSTSGDGDGGSLTDWNQVSGTLNNTGITAGNVKLHDAAGGTVDDVAISFTNLNTGAFNNDGNTAGWGGTGADPYYILAADDIYFHAQTADFGVTFSGLNDRYTYNLRSYNLIGNNGGAVYDFNVTDGAGTQNYSGTNSSRWTAPTLEAAGLVFSDLRTDGAGQITATYTDPNAFAMNAIVLEANINQVAVGTKIGIDLGPTATDFAGNDWNEFAAFGSDNSIHDLDGLELDGVSVTVASGSGGFNNDGTNNWVGLSSNPTPIPGPKAPVEFVDEVTTDIVFSGTGSITVTIDGLNDSLLYNIDAVSVASVADNTEVLTVNGDTGSASSFERLADARDDGVFHSFEDVSSVGGTLTLVFTQDGGNNPIVNGILIEVVPEPSSLALLGLGGLALLRRRR